MINQCVASDCFRGYLTPPGAGFMPITYGYYHNILILFGALSIIKPNSADAVLMVRPYKTLFG